MKTAEDERTGGHNGEERPQERAGRERRWIRWLDRLHVVPPKECDGARSAYWLTGRRGDDWALRQLPCSVDAVLSLRTSWQEKTPCFP